MVRESTEIVFSAVVIGELLFGFRNGSRLERNTRELDELFSNERVSVSPVTRTTADRFGRIAASLRKAGTPMPTNDIWIAAHAFESGAELDARLIDAVGLGAPDLFSDRAKRVAEAYRRRGEEIAFRRKPKRASP